MCGIVGLISQEDVVQDIIEGLKRLEYRGYDSAGVATVTLNGLDRRRAAGKLKELETLCQKKPLLGTTGIGHTRWATHGVATVENAHPHANHRVALVHNGIIENYSEFKEVLSKKYSFESQTDTEVIVYLIEEELEKGFEPLKAVQNVIKKLKGAYAIAIVFKDHPELMIAVRQGSPLVLGIHQDKGTMLGSDAITLAPWAESICYMEDGDLALLDLTSIEIYDKNDQKVDRPFKPNTLNMASIGKGDYRHYMLKEIFEQSTVMGNALRYLFDPHHTLTIPDVEIDFSTIDRISIIACGTSYYSGMVAKYWIEHFAKISVDVDIASEFRYRDPVFSKNHLSIFISQSGETIDTLAALELAKKHTTTLGIVNVPQSSIARMADHVMYTHAGPEIGVASTKAFTCQLVCLMALTIIAARQKGLLHKDDELSLVNHLRTIPDLAHQVLHNNHLKELSQHISTKHLVITMGRGLSFPIALEAALKLKEITYIPSHAYAAGEMKHGPIAMIDETVPVIILAPFDKWFEKTCGNIQEVLARKGDVIVFTDELGFATLQKMIKGVFVENKNIFIMPHTKEEFIPFLYVLPMQLLTYYTGIDKGTDIDQPRNLAKSVTVE